MLGKRRLTVATVAVLAGASWAVFIAPSSQVAAAPAKGDTVRTSLFDGSPGDQAPDGGNQSVISGNGRYQAFVSTDTLDPNIEPNDGQKQIFVRGLDSNHTTQISVETDDGFTTGGGDEDSRWPDISTTGRYVSFVTDATNIGGGKDANELVVVCDRDPNGNGVFDEPVSASDPQADVECVGIADAESVLSAPKLSGDGSVLVWGIPGNGDNTFDSVEVAAVLDSGGTVTRPGTVNEVSNTTTLGTSNLEDPVVSADGQNVVYSGREANGTATGIFETDLSADAIPGGTTRVDTNSDNVSGDFVGTATVHVSHPTVSGNGSVVAYQVDGDEEPPLPSIDVSSSFRSTFTVTEKPTGSPDEFAFGDGIQPALSADGRYIAFVTDQADMVDATPPDDAPPNRTCINGQGVGITDNTIPCQVVVRDVFDYYEAEFGGNAQFGIGFAQLASAVRDADCDAPTGTACDGDFDSTNPSLSEHGKVVAFDSFADDLVPNDDNETCGFECEEDEGAGSPVEDTFARTWTPKLRTPNLNAGNVHVGQGKAIQYTITSPPSQPDPPDNFGPQILGDPIDPQHPVVKITPVTGDGFSVDDTGCGGGSDPATDPSVLYQGETCTVTVIFAPTAQGPVQAQLTVFSDGKASPPAILNGNGTPPLPPGNHEIVRTSVGDGDPGLQADDGTEGDSMVSGNGRYDVFATSDPMDGHPTRGYTNIYVRDLRNNTTQQITFGANLNVEGPTTPNGTPANDNSFDPTISADGRLVSFRTDATNIVPTGQNSVEGETASTVVVCDRDPDGDGVFDETQTERPGVPDFRCIYVNDQVETFNHNQDPRLSPDGKHLAYVECSDIADFQCTGTEQIVLVTLPHGPGQGLTGFTDKTEIPTDSFGDNVDRNDPQVSNQGVFGNPNRVRIAYYTGFQPSAIWVVDVVNNVPGTPHRIDVVPPGPLPQFCDGARPCFLGDSQAATVGEPSMTDDGTAVAFERVDEFNAIAEAYIADVNGKGGATTRPVATTRNGTPVRAADPALSGDGRYVSYVTDRPNFDGSNQKPPNQSCLVQQESDFLAVGAPPGYTPCQIVARDLVLDANRASAGLDPLPDALVTVGAPCSSPLTVFGSTCGGDDDSLNPSMSRIGSEVGFDSYADDLVPHDTNPVDIANEGSGRDAFVRTFFPTATLTPVHFGNVPVGSSSSQMGTLTVTGFGPYQLADATVGGTNPGDFTVTGATCALPGQVLHIGETCQLTFTFTPGGKGPRSATVTVSGDNNPNTTTITVTGDGQASTSAMISADPDPVNFGSGLPLDRPGRVRKVTITNGGGSTLLLNQVTVVDGSVPNTARDYTVDTTACGFMLPAGKSCKIKITWVGHAIGSRPATLRVVDNAPGGVQMIRLRAFVPKPSVNFTPSVVPTGRLTSVEGHGFAPNRLVLITLPDSGETATGRTTRRGNFATPLILFPNGILGYRIVQAHSIHSDKSITAKHQLLVVLGTLQSPTLVIRH